MNLHRVYTWTGHAFAFCGVGWGLVYHVTGLGLYVSLACSIVAVYSWSRASAFSKPD